METVIAHLVAAKQFVSAGIQALGGSSGGQPSDGSVGASNDPGEGSNGRSDGSQGASNDPNEGMNGGDDGSPNIPTEVLPADPAAFEHLFEGELGGQLESLLTMSDGNFERLVNDGSIDQDFRFTLTGEPVWGTGDDRRSLDRLAAGEPSAAFRQTAFFEVEPMPGDGVIVMDFWIAEEQSGGFLAGDNRGYVDPLGGQLGLDDSRLSVIIDRESGRAMVTVAPTTVRTLDVPASLESLFTDPFFQRGNSFNDLITVPARPIVFGPNPGLTSGIHDNYFQVDSDGQMISVDYDSINSVTAIGHGISVDGPIVIEHGPDGTFQVGEGHDPDAYPSIAVVQYLPDGTQQIVYEQENEPVIPGAIGD